MKRARSSDEEEEEEEEDDDDDEMDEEEIALIQERAYEACIGEVRELVGPEAPNLLRDTTKRICAVCPTRTEFTGWRGLIAHAETIRDRKKFVNRHRGYYRALVEVLSPNSRMHGTTPTPAQKMKHEVSKEKLRSFKIEEKKELVASSRSAIEAALNEATQSLETDRARREEMQRRFAQEISRLDEDFERRMRRQQAEFEKVNLMLREKLDFQDSKTEKEKMDHLEYLQRLRAKESRNAQETALKLQAMENKKQQFEASVREAEEKFRQEHDSLEMDLIERESKEILELQMQFEKEIAEAMKESSNTPVAAAPPSSDKKDECSHCLEDFENCGTRALLIPCGHALMCMECAKKVQQEHKSCPHCRAPIEQVHKFYK
ncbi:hypothetical protein SELMODRAFT_444468 [Selaginella moellendorffii]|uniref:RING-type domain-containing protein n=1 Tax=Selaginella moellendorffii TaxID=88036 RepID=D8SAT2_SELML|nr:trichohyalin [Selaginella moellendorffii]EFJ18650.1 hypothetical protein SELMODRAFT_444468 [Selaginella moellendorffii]|eukprot:XP_002980390.1 trichohyalin [Selaginella moellendorffii]